MDNKFVVELPQDKYGNTGMHLAVLEVRVQGRDARILAPESHVKYGTFYTDVMPHADIVGPARPLTDREYVQVLIVANVNEQYIERAKALIDDWEE